MNTTDIISLEYHQEFSRRAVLALENGAAVAVCGDEGSGVTSMGRFIAQSWKARGERKLMTFTAFGESDKLKLSQHLASQILGDSMPSDWRLHCTSHLLSLMTAKIVEAKVGLIFIDRADSAPRGFIDSILTVANTCGDSGWKVGVLLGIRHGTVQMPLFAKAEVSLTSIALRCQIEPLDSASILAVLCEMSSRFTEFRRQVESNEAVAINALNHLTKVSNGNFRRLRQFADYMNQCPDGLPAVAALIDRAWKDAFGLESMKLAA